MNERQPVAEQLLDNYCIAQYYRADPVRQRHENLADQLAFRGNKAFTSEPHAHYALVPLAAASETQTRQTLEVLAKQSAKAPQSTATVVSLNTPQKLQRVARRQVRANAEVIADFMRTNPDMPLSYYHVAYPTGTTIGSIRNDLYASVVQKLVRQHGHRNTPDVLLTCWDADTLGASAGYFADTQQYYKQSDAMAYRSHPMLRHTRVEAERFPRANQLLAWYDLSNLTHRAGAPAHTTINLGALGVSGGMFHNSLGEQIWMWNAVERHAARFSGEAYTDSLEHHWAAVSPRHLLGKMAISHNIDYAGISVGSKDWQSYPALEVDVSQAFFIANVKHLATRTYNGAHNVRHHRLSQQGLHSRTVNKRAHRYAEQYLDAAAKILDDTQATRTIIDGVIAAQRSFRAF